MPYKLRSRFSVRGKLAALALCVFVFAFVLSLALTRPVGSEAGVVQAPAAPQAPVMPQVQVEPVVVPEPQALPQEPVPSDAEIAMEQAPEASAPTVATSAPIVAAPVVTKPVTAPPAPKPAPAPVAPVSKPDTTQSRVDANGLSVSWSVQVASLANRESAESLQKTLRSQGYNAYIRTADGKNRVFVGPLIERAEADRLRDLLNRKQNLKGFVVRFQPERG